MGIDLLDLFFRIEHDLDVRLVADDVTSIASRRHPPDITAGELFEVVMSRRRVAAAGSPVPSVAADETRARKWRIYCQNLAACVGVEPDEIKPDMLLSRDLGLT